MNGDQEPFRRIKFKINHLESIILNSIGLSLKHLDFRPGNWQWEPLFDNIDDAKVILTVRGKKKLSLEILRRFQITKKNGLQVGRIFVQHKLTKTEFGEGESLHC